MKKVYKTLDHVVDSDPNNFGQCVGDKIQELQSRGYRAEVQYQIGQNGTLMHYTALILGYTMEDDQ